MSKKRSSSKAGPEQLAIANEIIKKLAINCAAIISIENRVLVNSHLRARGEREI